MDLIYKHSQTSSHIAPMPIIDKHLTNKGVGSHYFNYISRLYMYIRRQKLSITYIFAE